MKKILILLLLILPIVNAQNPQIIISSSRDNYASLETFQAEIFFNIDPVNEITISNFILTDNLNNKIPIALFLTKISNNHYFVYFNLPDLAKGMYNFNVVNVRYIDQTLKQISISKSFTIESANPGFTYLINQQNQDGSFNTVKETALATLALKNTYPENSQKAISYLINNIDNSGCFPKNNCNTIATSFALLAFKEFNKDVTKTKNWLKDAQNNFNIGTWSLNIETKNSTCNINNNNYNINNKLSLQVTNNNVLVNCSSSVFAYITHSYLGNIVNLSQMQGNYINLTIDDSGCYGVNYRGDCDYEATDYAIYSLSRLNEIIQTKWLENNAKDTKTLDQALLYLVKKNSYSYDWLLNNFNNGWPYYSGDAQIDVYSSAFAAFALSENKEIFENSKLILSKRTTESVSTSSLILYFLFQDESLPNSISVSPGIINTRETKLEIKNNYNKLNLTIEAPSYLNLPKDVTLDNFVSFNIKIPINISKDNIKINYNEKSYLIPIILETIEESKNVEAEPLLAPPKEVIIFLNSSYGIGFPKEIKIDKFSSPNNPFYLLNKWDFTIRNISFVITGNLKEIIRLNITNVNEIKPNETLQQYIWINERKNPSLDSYNGEILILHNQGVINALPLSIGFKEKNKSPELNQTVENETSKEKISNKTVTPEKEENKKSYLPLIIIAIIIVIIILILAFLATRKKEKEPFEEFIGSLKR